MKKALALLLALVMCLSLAACGKEKLPPEERLPDEITEYISENYRIKVGSEVSEAVNVDIASVVELKEDSQWAVMGTYTVKVGKEIMSAKFGMVATYDEASDGFTYSQEEFDDFK